MKFPLSFSRARSGISFVYPSGEAPLTVVLQPGYRESANVRCCGDLTNVGELHEEAIAGTMEQLRYVARQSLSTVTRGIVVFRWNGDAGLSEGERDYLWRRFGVPVFEQYLSRENRLLATECDAHAGLHVVAAAVARDGYRLESKACPCGNKHPRLIHMDQAAAPAFTTKAATA